MNKLILPVIYLLIFLLCSCDSKSFKKDQDIAQQRATILNSDSLFQILEHNKEMYNSYADAGKNDTALYYLNNTISLEKYASGNNKLTEYFQSAVLSKAYEMDRIEKYAEVEELLQQLLNKQGIVWINELHQADAAAMLGNIYTRYGDYKKALTYLNKAKEIYAKANDTVYYVKAVNNEVIALQELDRNDSALSLLMDAEKWNTPATESRVILYSSAILSCIDMGKIDMAEIFILKAFGQLKYFDDEMDRDYYEAALNELKAEIFFAKKDWERSAQLTKSAIGLNEINKSNFRKTREAGKLFSQLGRCFLILNKVDTALYYYQQSLYSVSPVDSSNIFSLPSKQQLYAENTIMEALDAKAEAFQLLYKQKPELKYLQTAIQCYDLSFEVERKLMQYFSYDESKLLMLQESRFRSQSAINLCYKLYQLTKSNAWAEKAFQFAEKNKAFVLLESVKRNLAANSALQNDTLYKKTQSLQLQLAYNERSIAEAEDDSAKAKLADQKDKLENELLFAKTAMARQSNAYKAVMEKEDSISANLVSTNLLNEHTGLVEFFSADSATYAFVLNKNQPLQFIKYNAPLSAEIDSVLAYFKTISAITNYPVEYQKAAYRLYNTLGFQQLDKAWQNLIIIPDGKLCFLPFDALITTATASINLQQASYFINHCNTVYGYSAQILLEQHTGNSISDDNIAVFAPVFEGNQNNQLPLLYSLEEANAVAANKNTQLFLKEKATLNNFKNLFNQSGILHIATHAYADTGINSNSRIEFIDSSLLLNELYALHTNASLVVLSSCETGIGQLNKSEGSMSLARGFYYAGAKNVITSYWNVDDKSTATLFTSFYKEINANTYSDALYNAKKEFIKNARATSASPYYWAGFVHIGLPKKKAGNKYWWCLLLIPMAVVIYYRVKKK